MQEETDDNHSKRETADLITEKLYSANAMLPSQLVRMVIIGNRRAISYRWWNPLFHYGYIRTPFCPFLIMRNCIQSGKDAAESWWIVLSTKKVLMIPLHPSIQHPYQVDEDGCIFTEVSLSVITETYEKLSGGDRRPLFFQVGDDWYQLCRQYAWHRRKEYGGAGGSVPEKEALSGDTAYIEISESDDGGTFIMITRPSGSFWLVCFQRGSWRSVLFNIFRTFFWLSLLSFLASALSTSCCPWFLSNTVNVPVRSCRRAWNSCRGGFRSGSGYGNGIMSWGYRKNINDLSENVVLSWWSREWGWASEERLWYKMLQSQINPHFSV